MKRKEGLERVCRPVVLAAILATACLLPAAVGGEDMPIDAWAWPSEEVPKDPDAACKCMAVLVSRDGLATLVCVREPDVFLAHTEYRLEEGDSLECRPEPETGKTGHWFKCRKEEKKEKKTEEDTDREPAMGARSSSYGWR